MKSEIFMHGDVETSGEGSRSLKSTKYNPIVREGGRTKQVVSEVAFTSPLKGGHVVMRERVAIHTKPGSVTIVASRLYTGVNQKSGKRYYRWETDSIDSLFLTSLGNFNAIARQRYARRRKRKGLKFVSTEGKAAFFRAAIQIPDDILEGAMQLAFGRVVNLLDIYPALRVFSNDARHGAVAPWIRNVPLDIMKKDDPRDFVRHVLGDYNKSVLRIKNTPAIYASIYPALLMSVGKLDVPLEWKVSIIEQFKNAHGTFSYTSFNNVMNALDNNQRKSLFNKMLDCLHVLPVVNDTFNTLSLLLERDFDIRPVLKLSTLHEIHDKAWQVLDELKHKNVTIDCWDNPELNMGIGNVDWYLASETHEIRGWGRRFNHCIGSYADQVSSNNIFGIIRRDGKEIGNFQIENGTLLQFYGTNNRRVSEIDLGAYNTFITHLKDAGYNVGFWTDRVDADAIGW